MIKQEWLSLWKEKKLVLSIVVMFIMPLLYAGMLLWAFWNPYGHLDQLPVALVNDDKGAEFEGEHLQLGNDLITNLNESGTFNFIEVTSKEADKMLEDQDAYIAIKIPEQFSQHATTLLDENPQKLELEYRVNEASNFLSSKIGDNAINSIRTEVNEQVAKTYAEQLFAAIDKLSNGFGDASDGASKLFDGISTLQDGTVDLKGYLEQLATNTVTLADGANSLANGVTSAKDGTEQLVSGTQQLQAGGSQLVDGSASIQNGAASLASGVTDYTNGVTQIAENHQKLVEGQQTFQSSLAGFSEKTGQLTAGAASVASSTEQLAAGIASLDSNLSAVLATLPEEQAAAIQASLTQLKQSSAQIATGASSLSSNSAALQAGAGQLVDGHSTIVANSEKLAQGMQQVVGNSSTLVSGANNLATGSSTFTSKLSEFNNGVASVASGASSLNSGLGELATGANKVASGTSTLREKSGELADGSDKLVDGSSKLSDGASELTTSLSDAKDESSINTTNNHYEMVASPVEVDKEIKNKVANYGTGLAPYFISLGLFVGALLLTNVYPFVQPAVHPTGVWNWFVSKSFVPFTVWIFQTAILSLFLLYVLKLEVTNLPLFITLMAVTSFTFIAIVQLLTVLLEDVGRFIALVFLILQLASSAGTFPVELLPDFLQKLNSYLPMSYSVEALRHVISATDYIVVYKNMALLGSIGVVCVALTVGFFALLYKRRYSKPIEISVE